MATVSERAKLNIRAGGKIPGSFFMVVVSLVGFFLALALAEGVARLFWKVRYDVPFSRSDKIIYAFYPELWDLDWKGRSLRQSNPLKILLLGGSVLNPSWSSIAQDLEERLTSTLKRPVVMYNLGQIGHTSRDSYLKYRSLANRHFDLIVFYHGINESRTDNVPPDLFRPDYAHYSWYETVNTLQKYRDSKLILPYTLEFLWIRLKESFGISPYVSIHTVSKDWFVHGREIKSAASFETNLRAILEIAQERNEPVLLMTFATYLPKDYSQAAFKERRLDYALHLSPIELWGSPENVIKAVARYNAIVRGVASQYSHVRLVDQDNMMPKGHHYFNDVCHLTSLGSAKFVDNLLNAALQPLNGVPMASDLKTPIEFQ